ncbi:hypothetical protein LC605_00290 [Nostoc sp. CHAB 5836]|nr:hypothetical protein [Nostoc sp. CHAB 5836]
MTNDSLSQLTLIAPTYLMPDLKTQKLCFFNNFLLRCFGIIGWTECCKPWGYYGSVYVFIYCFCS